MSEREVEGGDQPDIDLLLTVLENYCHGDSDDVLSLEGLRERIAGIPADAVRGSNFFHRACKNERVTLEIVQCLLDAFPDTARSTDGHELLPLHYACMNVGVSLEIVECLLRAFPDAVRTTDEEGRLPLHYACQNMDPGIVRVLLDCWPESVNHRDSDGDLPLHHLCEFGDIDEASSLATLDLLLTAAPLSATIAGSEGYIPIHIAIRSGGKSYPFYKRLIDAAPEALRVQSEQGWLPIHAACYVHVGNVETVKCMLELDPEGIRERNGHGDLPIHSAVGGELQAEDKADVVHYLLTKDPNCAAYTDDDQCLPLHLACEWTCLDTVRLLFDAYPEAINIQDGDGKTPIDVEAVDPASGPEVRGFLEAQLVYARQAENIAAMHTPDHNGWLPLHHALRNRACLGAIKLLIAGNPDALHISENQLAFPLHIACEFSKVEVVQYLLGFSDNHLHTLDLQGDSTLHYACRGGNLGVVKCLLERGVPSVSEPNNAGKLPVHLLWESDRVDRNSAEYVEANWLLFLAHPETVMH